MARSGPEGPTKPKGEKLAVDLLDVLDVANDQSRLLIFMVICSMSGTISRLNK